MNRLGMRTAMLELIDALSNGAAALEEMAAELVQAAAELAGEPGTETMLWIAREHRVRALEMQGQRAALYAEDVQRFLQER